jgi:hypothetical protein
MRNLWIGEQWRRVEWKVEWRVEGMDLVQSIVPRDINPAIYPSIPSTPSILSILYKNKYPFSPIREKRRRKRNV